MNKRSDIEKFIVSHIGKISELKENTDTYANYFKSLTDAEFDKFMSDLESGEKFLTIVAPNFNDGLNIERNFEIGDSLGHSFFERLWITDAENDYQYLTPNPVFVSHSIVRRASQMLQKKMSVPSTNDVIDKKSGQVTGESKGAKVSYIELRLCSSMGLDEGLEELVKYKGGDIQGGHNLDNMLMKYGKADLGVLRNYSSTVKSVETSSTILTGMHLKNTLKSRKV